MEKIINHPLFSWLTPLISLILIGVLQYLYYRVYIPWKLWAVILIGIFIAVFTFVFVFWAGTQINLSGKALWIFTAVFSVGVLVLYFIGMAVVLLVKSNNYLACRFGTISCDIILLLTIFTVVGVKVAKGNAVVISVLSGLVALGVLTTFCVYVGTRSAQGTAVSAVKDFTVLDTMPDGKGEKVKVILLNGQSNASGVSRVEYLKKNVSAEEFARYEKGYDNIYINYFNDNGNNTSGGAFARVAMNQGYDKNGFFGPEVGLADALSTAYPDETIIILKYAWGGSVLGTQWFAPQEDGSEGDLYRAFITFTKGCMEYLRSRNYDASIGAMCWMQGESDASDILAPKYYQNEKDMITALRSELSDYADKNGIAFVDAGISDSKYWKKYKEINAAKKKLADESDLHYYIDTLDLSYDKEPAENPDLAHYDSMAQITLGNRFGQAVQEIYSK